MGKDCSNTRTPHAERSTRTDMSAKQIEVTCPCCQSKLLVDVLTAMVMRTEKAQESKSAGDTWSAAQDKVRQRTKGGVEKLESALDAEKGKKDRLDELFQKAKDKLQRGDTD
jgi:hypothetical protein